MVYTLIRSQRKTCAIHIRNNTVEVRAPLRMPELEIERFVDAKAAWITRKLAEASDRAEQRAAFSLTYGDLLPYRGKNHPIIASSQRPDGRIGWSALGFSVPPDLSPQDIKNACVQIYRQCAQAVLREKTLAFAATMGVRPAAIKISGAKTRWGSCSAQQSINFSWRLMMASDLVIDYVVVHELAHLREMNHSARFWALVKQVLPAYQERRQELRLLQDRLRTEDWN